MPLQNRLPTLSLTGPLAQRRHQSLETRITKRSEGHHPLSPPQPPNLSTNLATTLPQAISRPPQTSPSASPTSSPTTTAASPHRSPEQLSYRQSQVLYHQILLRLNLLLIESQNCGHCRKTPQPRDAFVSFLEKQQEIAALQERITSMIQAIRDLSEGEDGVWGEANVEWEGGDEVAAGSAETEEWIGGRLTNGEINEAMAEAWGEVYPGRELGWYS